MTCKDCFHFEVCDSGRHIGEHIDDDGVYSEGVEKECPVFKSKSDYEKAMEKQRPKKFEIWNGQCCCPNCRYLFGNNETRKRLIRWDMPFCKNCGQALDWSDNK